MALVAAQEDVFVGRTVEVKCRSVRIRPPYESTNTRPVAFVGRDRLGGDSGCRQFSLGALQKMGLVTRERGGRRYAVLGPIS